MRSDDKRVIKTKSAIRDALFTLLKNKPMNEITIKEVSEQACINRKTFYTHYADLEEVLSEMEDELVGNVAYFLKKVMMDEYSLSPQYFLQLVNMMYSSNPVFFENLVLVRNYMFLIEKLKKVLKEEVIECMNIPSDRLTQTSIVLEYFIGGVAYAYADWIRMDKPISFEKFTILLSELMLNGYSSAFLTLKK